MRPVDLKSSAEYAVGRPHGTRIRYLGGCKCVPCRAANSRYETERALARKNGDWNGFVKAERTARHLKMLSARGIGRGTVSEISGISEFVIGEINAGRKLQIRARTQRKILSVTRKAVNGAMIIPAGPTNRLIDLILAEGFTKGELAVRLGLKMRSIQFNRERITMRTAVRVERFYKLMQR